MSTRPRSSSSHCSTAAGRPRASARSSSGTTTASVLDSQPRRLCPGLHGDLDAGQVGEGGVPRRRAHDQCRRQVGMGQRHRPSPGVRALQTADDDVQLSRLQGGHELRLGAGQPATSASISRANPSTRSTSTPAGASPSRRAHGSRAVTPARIVPPVARCSVPSGSRGSEQPASTSAAIPVPRRASFHLPQRPPRSPGGMPAAAAGYATAWPQPGRWRLAVESLGILRPCRPAN